MRGGGRSAAFWASSVQRSRTKGKYGEESREKGGMVWFLWAGSLVRWVGFCVRVVSVGAVVVVCEWCLCFKFGVAGP